MLAVELGGGRRHPGGEAWRARQSCALPTSTEAKWQQRWTAGERGAEVMDPQVPNANALARYQLRISSTPRARGRANRRGAAALATAARGRICGDPLHTEVMPFAWTRGGVKTFFGQVTACSPRNGANSAAGPERVGWYVD